MPESVTYVGCVVREADYPRATVDGAKDASQLVLTAVDSITPSYAVTGVREKELASHAGRRVEVSGTIEPARTTPIVDTADGARSGSVKSEGRGAAGVTPDGAAAHEPSDALTATVNAAPVSPATPNPEDPAYRIATAPRLNVASFRVVSGGCINPTSRTATASAPQQAAPRSSAAAQAAVRPEPRRVLARGCLMRLTPGGTALTQQRDSQDAIVLTQASLAGTPEPAASAVPGGGASDRGSGTVPSPAATSGRGSADAGRLTFALSLPRETMAKITSLVGDRVEVEGVLADEPKPAPDRAHTSAPAGTITVSGFRPLGGACR